MRAYLRRLGDRNFMHISTIAPISNHGAPQRAYRTSGVWPAYDVGVKLCMKAVGSD
jgi:hypothetical protein